MDGLTLPDLAEASGLAVDDVARFVAHGMIESDQDGTFHPTAIARIRLVSALEDAGVSPTEIATALVDGRFSLGFVDELMPEPVRLLSGPRDATDLDELWATGVGPILGSGLASDRPLRADDAALLDLFGRATNLGASPEKVIAIVRTTAQSVSRLVDVQREFVDEVLLGPAISETGSVMAALEKTSTTRYQYRQLGRDLILLLLERFVDDAVFDNLVRLSEATLEQSGVKAAGGGEAVVFVDISRYTARSEIKGDEAAAIQATLLVNLGQELAKTHRARLVKSLGDGSMFHAPDARSGVEMALEAIEAAGDRGLWQLHGSVNVGTMVQRDGDLFGNAVNIASRISAKAEPGEVVVTGEVVAEMGDDDRFEFVDLGSHRLHNVSSPIPIYKVTRSQSTESQ